MKKNIILSAILISISSFCYAKQKHIECIPLSVNVIDKTGTKVNDYSFSFRQQGVPVENYNLLFNQAPTAPFFNKRDEVCLIENISSQFILPGGAGFPGDNYYFAASFNLARENGKVEIKNYKLINTDKLDCSFSINQQTEELSINCALNKP